MGHSNQPCTHGSTAPPDRRRSPAPTPSSAATAGSPTTAKVLLELELGSEPISGGLFADGQPERPFSDWLSLSSLLEQVSAGPFGLAAPSRSPGANDRWLQILRPEPPGSHQGAVHRPQTTSRSVGLRGK